jgi:hypothetical protein
MQPLKGLPIPRGLSLATLVITLLIDCALLGYFHNRFWWPPDEGQYAHTAERVLNGETLDADVQEIHPGYVTFLNAAALRLFGVRLVSLRYPLAAVALAQSLLLYLLFARHNLWLAIVAATSALSMGVIQYLNPSPNWYCLFLSTLVAVTLTYIPRDRIGRLELLGFLVALVFLFRQITGMFVAMGVLAYLLTESPAGARGRDTLLAQVLLGLLLVGTAVYLESATDLVGFVLFGFWPLAMLMVGIVVTCTPNNESLRIVSKLALGALTALVPLVIYHAAHGSLGPFFDDVVSRALTVSQFGYMKRTTYLTLQAYGGANLLRSGSLPVSINGAYWLILPCCGLVTGVASVRVFRHSRSSVGVGALPFIAVFYALVSLLNQIPIYLYFSLPLSSAGLFWLAMRCRRSLVLALAMIAIVLSLISVRYQAAQPISRGWAGIISGERESLVKSVTLPRSGLWIDSDSLTVYSELVRLIHEESRADETIFAIPNNSELYFLAQRKNPFRFWNTAIGVRDEKEAMGVVESLKRAPPRIITFVPGDKNNTPSSTLIIAWVRQHYALVKTVADFEVYRAP